MGILSGKVAIITGASRGIGRAIAQAFIAGGAKCVLTAKGNLGLLEDLNGVKYAKLDLSIEQDMDNLLEDTSKLCDRIDIFINNAAIFKQTEFDLISEKEFDNISTVDFKGPFLLLQKVFRQMKKQKYGKIVNIASGAGIMGSSTAAHYAACKAAMISLTKSLAKLGGPYNINVNAIAPGYIRTDMIKDILCQKREKLESLIPLGKIGEPKNVSDVALFLASEKSGYITGQIVCVDGGQCMV